MSLGPYHPYLNSILASERQQDYLRAAEHARCLHEAGIPTFVERLRLAVGQTIVRTGTLIAGSPAWASERRSESATNGTTVPATLKLAR